MFFLKKFDLIEKQYNNKTNRVTFTLRVTLS